MSILKIARMGHPVLRQVAKPIDPDLITSPEVQQIIRDILETMMEYNGVGLAAPQVHIPLCLAICGGEEDDEGRTQLRVLINPEITALTEELYGMWEGCLSIPRMRGYVERPAKVAVKAYDEKGELVEFELEGFPAVVVQHECDHLDGVLYVDRLKDSKLFAFEDEAVRFVALDEHGTVEQASGGTG